MELKGEFIDYADGILELENKFGKTVGNGDYFTFWENCERLSELKNSKNEEDLINKVLDIWENLGETQKIRSEKMWEMD